MAAHLQSCVPADIRDWCVSERATAVGVDAPCRWRAAGEGRAAERELARAGIFAFATPTREAADRSAFYRWMLNGAALYRELEAHFTLYDGAAEAGPVCFETFPQAVACALAGRILFARNKCVDRRSVLERAGVETHALRNIDYVDAALCAVSARHVCEGTFRSYGDASSGLIFVPNGPSVIA